MEYLSGPDLKQVIRRRAPLPPLQAIDYAQQILAALGAAHRRDVVHRDVKPQNVLVAEDGHLKVTDFGIARAGAQADMTEAGSVIGTAQYLSPEQARGDEVTAASDCYAVGIVLYEMLTGRVPFDGDRAGRGRDEADQRRARAAARWWSRACRPSSRRSSCGRWPSGPPSATAPPTSSAARSPRPGRRSTARAARPSVMPAAGPATAETRVMDPVTGPTRVGAAAARRAAAARAAGAGPGSSGASCCWRRSRSRAFLLLGGDDATAVTIPSVAGQSAAEAQATLEDAGLEVDGPARDQRGRRRGPGHRHRPARRAARSTRATPSCCGSAAGRAWRPCPTSRATRRPTRRAELQRADFEVDAQQEASDDVDEGIVIRQSPAGGAQAEVGSAVTIVVSSGPENVAVPDVQQQDLDERRGASSTAPAWWSATSPRSRTRTSPRARSSARAPGRARGSPRARASTSSWPPRPSTVDGPDDRRQHGDRRPDQARRTRASTSTHGRGRLGRAGRRRSSAPTPPRAPRWSPAARSPSASASARPEATPAASARAAGRATTAPGAAARSRPRREGCVRRRLAVLMGGPQQRARGVAVVGGGRHRRPRPGALRGDPGADLARGRLERRRVAGGAGAGARRRAAARLARRRARAAGRRGLPGAPRPQRRGRRRSRARSRPRARPTSAPASRRRRWPWTRRCSRCSCATPASPRPSTAW